MAIMMSGRLIRRGRNDHSTGGRSWHGKRWKARRAGWQDGQDGETDDASGSPGRAGHEIPHVRWYRLWFWKDAREALVLLVSKRPRAGRDVDMKDLTVAAVMVGAAMQAFSVKNEQLSLCADDRNDLELARDGILVDARAIVRRL